MDEKNLKKPANPNTLEATDNDVAMRRLFRYGLTHRGKFLVVVGLAMVYIFTQVTQPWLVKIAIDRDLLAAHPRFGSILTLGLLYLGITGAGLFANLMQNRRLQYMGQTIVREIRVDLFSHIESLSMRFFDNYATGRLMTNISSDTNQLNTFFTGFLLSLIQDGMLILFTMTAMLLLDWKLALISFGVIPVIVAISALFRSKLRTNYRQTRSHFSRLIGFTAENLGGMRITQIFHQEPKQLERFSDLNRHYTLSNIREYTWSVRFNRTFSALGNFAVAMMMWLGGEAVLHHTIAVGVLYAFVSYIQQFFNPINSLTQNWNTLQSALVSAERIGGVLLTSPEIQDPAHPIALPLPLSPAAGEVAFHHVSFGYAPERLILEDIDFTVPPRAFVGFVGETGAGKSTLMGLLARFYDVTHGRITIDGVDLRDFAQHDLHQKLAIVQQEVHLFSGTVADNIRLFRQNIPLETVEAAAEIAGALEFIRSMPGGFDAWLHPKGANLSLGQRQLLAFARALTLNPEILILDEATASLDSATELTLQRGLTRISRGRTTLVIAHRLSTIRDADRIFVMDEGRIVEQGSHQELIARGGTYAELVRKSSPDARENAAL